MSQPGFLKSTKIKVLQKNWRESLSTIISKTDLSQCETLVGYISSNSTLNGNMIPFHLVSDLNLDTEKKEKSCLTKVLRPFILIFLSSSPIQFCIYNVGARFCSLTSRMSEAQAAN